MINKVNIRIKMTKTLIVSIVLLLVGFGGWPTQILAGNKFKCPGASTKHVNTSSSDGYVEREQYCEKVSNDKRHGPTMIMRTEDFPVEGAEDLSTTYTTYTLGKWANGKRSGKWKIIDQNNVVLDECHYANGKLKSGDPSLCPQ
jgi:hypothetical protein